MTCQTERSSAHAGSQTQKLVQSRGIQCTIADFRSTASISTQTSDMDWDDKSDGEGEGGDNTIDTNEDDDDDDEWNYSAADNTDDCDSDDDGGVVFDELLSESSEAFSERKFIVFESCLRQLLMTCFICLQNCNVYLVRLVGSMVVLRQHCINGHYKDWCSQPCSGSMPCGNLAAASCLFFNGCSPVKFLNICHHLRLAMISLRTFNAMQCNYLVPAVKKVWRNMQLLRLQSLGNKNCIVGGDARCCSPGHTAKFGSYTIMDLESSKILDVQLIQVTEVKNSNAMELVGLKRCLNFLKSYINISEL